MKDDDGWFTLTAEQVKSAGGPDAILKQFGEAYNRAYGRIKPPYELYRHPPSCPDGDYCRANHFCYWDCQADPDAPDTASASHDSRRE